jgi:alpha-glucosidase
MKLAPLTGVENALVSELDGPVVGPLPLTTPWRVILLGDSPGQLLENNFLLLNLNDPCALQDTSWIRPGKVIREVTLTTTGGKACVDFAVHHGLQYVEFDAGWYGHEYDDAADATTITVDPKRSPGPLDLHEVIRYAESRDIGILVYVNRRALEKQLDGLLPLLRSWGIRGVKYGFVNVGSQEWTRWLHDAVRKAAEHQLMVDIHDEYRGTGFSRTYPNLMTMEGIRGDEARPSVRQTLITTFTRMLAGRADNTVCYLNPRVDELWSHSLQLAKPVCLFSPWQFLFWYDRPEAIGDLPELAFLESLPTTWDETRVLQGAIGEYAVIARRRGLNWFVGAMNAGEPRTLPIAFEFLDPGQAYHATLYTHDPDANSRTKVKTAHKVIRSEAVHELRLLPNNGAALRIVPTAANSAESRSLP